MGTTESQFRRAVEIANSIDFHFSEYARKARLEKVQARLAGDEARYRRIDEALRKARKSVNEALDLLEERMLSTEVVAELVDRLDGQAARARELLQDMREAADTLRKIEQGAKVALKVLETVRQVLA